MKLIKGLQEFLQQAHDAEIRMAVGSAAIMFNIDFVLDGTGIRKFFDAVVSADDVAENKPHPQTFLFCAERLRVSQSECLVFEDTPKGVEAAANAGMKAVVIMTLHQQHEFSSFKNVIGFANDFRTLKYLVSGSHP